MFVLVSGASKTVARLLPEHPNLGVLVVPGEWNALPAPGVTWAADNGAFSGFDEGRFRSFLLRLGSRGGDCMWVAAPDVVGDAAATLRLWRTWAPIIRARGLVPALVLQDGLDPRSVPWPEVGAVFVGGTTAYKLSASAAAVVAEAARRGLWSHMGRVNTMRRIFYAAAIGCRSVDGSSFSRFSRTHLPWALLAARQRPLGIS